MKSEVTVQLLLLSVLMIISGCTVDDEELQKAITDAFSPKFNLPYTEPQLTRITEIIPIDSTNGQGQSRFIYESDTYYSGNNIKFIWNSSACNEAFTFLNWDYEYLIREAPGTNIWNQVTAVREAYVGNAKKGFDPFDQQQLESFMSESERWVYSYDYTARLEKVHLFNDSTTYRHLTHNTNSNFYDSIADYRHGSLNRILKYQYGVENRQLLGILELNHNRDTTAVYTFEYESGDLNTYSFVDAIYANGLTGIPNTRCSYLFLNGPLWAWHFPKSVSKLYRDGILVYQALFEYDSSNFPNRVSYVRLDSTGTSLQYAEEIISEVLKGN